MYKASDIIKETRNTILSDDELYEFSRLCLHERLLKSWKGLSFDYSWSCWDPFVSLFFEDEILPKIYKIVKDNPRADYIINDGELFYRTCDRLSFHKDMGYISKKSGILYPKYETINFEIIKNKETRLIK